MAKSIARPSRQKTVNTTDAKATVLNLISQGAKVADAMRVVERTVETYRDWMRSDPGFKAEIGDIRAAHETAGDAGITPVPPFDVFCEQWLKQKLHPHQLRMWDVINGDPPRDMLPQFRYDTSPVEWTGRVDGVPSGRCIINIPPGFAKTTSISINWVTWLIHRNPNVRVIIVCKDQGLGKQILGAIKFRLTSSVFREMHMRFAPEGGWKDPDSSWTQTEIYVQGKGDGEKDPTVQVVGIGGRIYGARADVIILDDAVTLANVNEHQKQAQWLEQEVESRLDGSGLLAMLGTRVAPVDLYSESRGLTDFEENPVYTYFSQPAVLDEGDGSPDSWVTLWPERFPGKMLSRARRNERTWALVYQQQDVAEDATFNARAVEASINSARFPGPLTDKGMGMREGGRKGLYVIGGLDPATVGATAMIVSGLDRLTEKRYILDGSNVRNQTPAAMRDTIKHLTDTHQINEWVIERNAFQRFLTQDPELNAFLRSRGCKLTEHYTNINKFDHDFGTAAMAPLFLTCGEPPSGGTGGSWKKTPEKALIELPSPKQNLWVGELINQLVTWEPTGMKVTQKTDLVMALWFTEIAVQRILGRGRKNITHLNNPHASRAAMRKRTVVNLHELRQAQLEEEAG